MNKINLDKVQIAAPCTVSWNSMVGGDRVRHCGECKLNVFNVEKLSRDEAEELIARASRGERVCVRLFKRKDGTILTENCPKGLRLLRKARLKAAAARATLTALLFGAFGAFTLAATQSRPVDKVEKVLQGEVLDDHYLAGAPMVEPPPTPQPPPVKTPVKPMRTMGKIAYPPPPPPPQKK